MSVFPSLSTVAWYTTLVAKTPHIKTQEYKRISTTVSMLQDHVQEDVIFRNTGAASRGLLHLDRCGGSRYFMRCLPHYLNSTKFYYLLTRVFNPRQ